MLRNRLYLVLDLPERERRLMILTRPDIIRALDSGDVGITPRPKDEHIGPNSVDLHLADDLVHYNRRRLATGRYQELSTRDPTDTWTDKIPAEGYLLYPGRLYLGRTVERTFTPKHVPYIGGRSSVGRLGISIHCTAGFGDIGFDGTWTLEISVIEPVMVFPGDRLCQLWLFVPSTVPEHLYQGRYQGQTDVTASKMHEGGT